jgi:hypothetical protein
VVQLGRFRTSKVLVGAAVAAVAVTTLGAGSAGAVGPAYSTVYGPNCATAVDTPFAGQTTKTDSTLPTVTSVAWNHLTVTAKSGATARVTVKTTDDCAGAGDVQLELHNASTGLWSYPLPSDMSWTVSASGRAQTWTFDIPLHGTDAGSISVTHVFVASDFETASYDSTLTDPTLGDINFTPETYSDSDYHAVAPPKAAKLVVKLATTLAVNATPEPAKVGRSVTVKATLKKLRTSTYIADASQYVTLQYHLPGSSAWHSIKKVRTNSSGVASTTFLVTKKGTYGFRAVYAGSTYAAAVTSAADSVKVS